MASCIPNPLPSLISSLHVICIRTFHVAGHRRYYVIQERKTDLIFLSYSKIEALKAHSIHPYKYLTKVLGNHVTKMTTVLLPHHVES
jgi:hypothetical protein